MLHQAGKGKTWERGTVSRERTERGKEGVQKHQDRSNLCFGLAMSAKTRLVEHSC